MHLGDTQFHYIVSMYIVYASTLFHTCSTFQGFGIAEGRPKEDLKNMANAAGQSCRDFTPPGGETLEQVSHFVTCKHRNNVPPIRFLINLTLDLACLSNSAIQWC